MPANLAVLVGLQHRRLAGAGEHHGRAILKNLDQAAGLAVVADGVSDIVMQ